MTEKFYINYQSEMQTLKAWDKEEERKAQEAINKEEERKAQEEKDAWKKEARAEFKNYSSFFREYYGE